MKKVFFPLMVAAMASAAWAKPTFTAGPTMSFNADNNLLTVTYTLSEPAVVTATVFTNGIKVAVPDVRFLVGDVNRFVADASVEHAFYWSLDHEYAGCRFDASQVKVSLKAWASDLPPDYLVADLRDKKCVRYYETTNDIPGGVLNDYYKREAIVMRRIPAKDVQFRMGMTDTNRKTKYTTFQNDSRMINHLVTLKSDYYMGIFPVTQRQYHHYKSTQAGFQGAADAEIRPMEKCGYTEIRGTTEQANWPTTDRTVVGSGSWLAMIRSFTGVQFDLPTEAQWEFAARAGSQTELTSGEEYAGDGKAPGDANFEKVGWCKANTQAKYGTEQTGPVGCFAPNAWGLYDCNGNVNEWTIDWYQVDNTQMSDNNNDPKGPTAGSIGNYRTIRGGPWTYNCVECVLSKRNPCGLSGSNEVGFRLWAPCDASVLAH